MLSYGWLLWIPMQAGTIPAATRFFEESIRPVLALQPGFWEAHLFSDPVKSQYLVMTLWGSQAACQRAESSHACQTVFQQMEVYFADQPTVVRCEVMGQIG